MSDISSRVRDKALQAKIVSAEQAAEIAVMGPASRSDKKHGNIPL